MVLTWDPEAPVMPGPVGEPLLSVRPHSEAPVLGPECSSVPWAGQRWDRGDGDGWATQPGALVPVGSTARTE